MIGSLIVGALIGMIAGSITNRGESMGCIYRIFAGLVGSYVGQTLFGYWGPSLAGNLTFGFRGYYCYCCCGFVI